MKTILILSGGMDSAVLLWDLLSRGAEVKCITFNYGQKHHREIEAATKLCTIVNVKQHVLNIEGLGIFGDKNSQTSGVPVPHGRYDEENMKLTVVPNRNMIMLSLAVAYAISNNCDYVAYGAHAGDHTIYPDCRPKFVQALSQAIDLCDWNPPKLTVPYVTFTKGEVAKIGKNLNVPWEHTWTCYEGGLKPCGLCGSCTERAEAFEFAGIVDPLLK